MRKIYLFLLLVAVASVACNKDYTDLEPQCEKSTQDTRIRTYDEAFETAELAMAMIFDNDTRSSNGRKIMKDAGQCVTRPITRGDNTTEEPIMYIFNNENNEGFTVIAADKTQSPFIAVVEQGNYTYGEPTGVEPFDEYMESAVENLVETSSIIPPTGPVLPTPREYNIFYNDLREKEPLLTTKWGQHGIYNDYCIDEASDSEVAAGCVMTAIAQVMAYHRFPSSITTTYPSNLPYGGGQTINLNWDAILAHEQGHSTYASCNDYHYQISALFREIGHRAGCTYQIIGNKVDLSATIDDAISVLRSFGYETSDAITPNTSNIYGSLDNNRPVWMRGYDTSIRQGHAWVVDGYYDYKYGVETYTYGGVNLIPPSPNPQVPAGYVLTESTVVHTKLLHINWGWDGSYNGWFNWDDYRVRYGVEYDENSAGNSNDNFDSYNKMTYNIYPNQQ